ncbi:MAG TPA: cytochrome c biogenesis protein CcdA [Thermoleophilaceae bacterium]|nr:cytochrome c biogenesis protein CcdA [Thermoleophilaceae bacterium]
MIDTPTISLAFAAGIVSFVSPCCLPLVPGYLAAVTGRRPEERDGRVDRGVIGRSLLFIGTFSAIFILLGLTATAVGAFLFESKLTLQKVGGVVIILMGALFIGSVFVTRLNREWRPTGLIERAGRGGPMLAGVAFSLAWTPCVGPTLGAILSLGATQASAPAGAGLLAVYSAGLGIPFLLSALGFDAAQRSFDWVKRHYAAIQVGAGAVLVAMGVLVYTNELFMINIEIQRALDGLGLNFFQDV